MTMQTPSETRCAVCGRKCEVMVVSLERPTKKMMKEMTAKKLSMHGWSKVPGSRSSWVCNSRECRKFSGVEVKSKVMS